MDGNVSVHIVFLESHACVHLTNQPDLEGIEQSKGPFISSFPEICANARLTDNEKTKLLTVSEFMKSQFTTYDCSTEFASDKKPKTCFSIYSDEVLVCVSP